MPSLALAAGLLSWSLVLPTPSISAASTAGSGTTASSSAAAGSGATAGSSATVRSGAPETGLHRRAQARARERSEHRFFLWTGPRGAVRFGNGGAGGGGAFAVGAAVRLYRGLRLVADVAEGYYSGPGQLLGQIRLGLGYELWTRPVRPFFFLGLDHAHQQDWGNFLDEPGRTFIGSSDTIDHRTGPAAGVGVRALLSRDPRRKLLSHLSLTGRLDFSYFADTKASPVVLALGAYLTATF